MLRRRSVRPALAISAETALVSPEPCGKVFRLFRLSEWYRSGEGREGAEPLLVSGWRLEVVAYAWAEQENKRIWRRGGGVA